MEILVEIIKTIIWPVTVLISVLILRKGILELIPNLKKLKYKELELEFEKEVIEINANIERDVPRIELEEKLPQEEGTSYFQVKYAIAKLSPSDSIQNEWEKIEKALLSLSDRYNVNLGIVKSIRSITLKLKEKGIIDAAIENALLELSAYRNKVVHTHRDIINENISNAYYEGSMRILNYLNSLKP